METSDYNTYPPGVYTVEITGKYTNQVSEWSKSYTLTLEHPCSATVISVDPIPQLTFVFGAASPTTHLVVDNDSFATA